MDRYPEPTTSANRRSVAIIGVLWMGWVATAALWAAPATQPASQPAPLTPTEAFLGARTVSGSVYYDDNGNGRRDPGEGPAAGVRLTGGDVFAVTDADGRYTLSAKEPFLTVTLCFPDGTWPTAGWFARLERDRQEPVDFALRREQEQLPLVFVHLTDPHGSIDKSLPAIFKECQSLPIRPRFYLVTGDLRGGDPRVDQLDDIRRQFAKVQAAVAAFPAPIFLTPGNHDTVEIGPPERVIPPETQAHPFFGSRAFEKFVNPVRWSFTCAGVHFVGWPWADYVGGQWESVPPAARRWLDEDLKDLPAGTRTVLATHAGAAFNASLILSGHTHAEGPAFGKANHLQGGTSAIVDRKGNPEAYGADGRPVGYRLVVVEKDRLDHFFRPFGVTHPIMVNAPRRSGTPAKGPTLTLQAQVLDPEGKLAAVEAALDGRPIPLQRTPRRLWTDLAGELDVSGLDEGFYTLQVTATFPDAVVTLSEPQLVRTGKNAPFQAAGGAVLNGQRERMTKPITVLVNGRKVGQVQPTDKTFAFEVPADALCRLNVVTFADNTEAMPLKNPFLEYQGQEHHDQRTLGWWPDQRISAKDTLYIDLQMPGPIVDWAVTPK